MAKTLIKHSSWLIISCVVSLSSCHLLQPIDTNKTKFTLSRCPQKVSVYPKSNHNLLVMPIEVDTLYDRKKMAYKYQSNIIQYFKDSQWAAAPGDMAKPLLINAVQMSNKFNVVLTPPTISKYDYVLKTTIIDFYQDYGSQPGLFKLTMEAELTQYKTKRVVFTYRKTILQPISKPSPNAGSIAANQAFCKMLTQFTAHLGRISS